MIEQCIEELKPIAKYYKVNVNFSDKLPKWVDGLSHKKNGFTINTSGERKREQIISTFFHELGHVYCKRNKLWESYHNPRSVSIQKVRRTALKAELWIDRWAITEMENWFPNIEYTGSYINMKRYTCKKIFYENYLNKYYKEQKIIN